MTKAMFRRRFQIFCLSVGFFAVAFCISTPRAEAQQGPVGDLSVVGEVTVNGSVASTGDIVASGSTVETIGQNSSAVISLGKLGRVTLLPSSRMQLFYDLDRRAISIMLDAGSVRVLTGVRVTSTVTRR